MKKPRAHRSLRSVKSLKSGTMFSNYLKIAWRNLRNRKGFALINILGLALGFGCAILIFLFVSHHVSYDTFHDNPDRIYRVVTEMHEEEVDYIASVPPGFVNAFRNDYEYTDKVGKLVTDYNRVVDLETAGKDIKFKQDIVFAEQELFEIFDFPLVDETNDIALTEPNTALVTDNMAHKMFGDENPVGKTFTIDSK